MVDPDGCLLVESLMLHNVVKEFTVITILHNQVQLSFSFDDLWLIIRFSGLTSYSWITLGWRIFFKIFISLEMRSMSFLSLIRAFSRILIATLSPVKICSAILTLPKVPLPRFFPNK